MRQRDVTGLNNLLVTVFNTILKIEEAALKESSHNQLSMTEVHTLAAIGLEKSRTMTEIATDLMINVSTLTAAINKLEKKGYANRIKSEDDRRVVRIELTENGIAILQDHERFHQKMVEQVVENLGEEEARVLMKSMSSLMKFFRKQYELLK
jgi:DNA-binding MarR family transcriptional regulator